MWVLPVGLGLSVSVVVMATLVGWKFVHQRRKQRILRETAAKIAATRKKYHKRYEHTEVHARKANRVVILEDGVIFGGSRQGNGDLTQSEPHAQVLYRSPVLEDFHSAPSVPTLVTDSDTEPDSGMAFSLDSSGDYIDSSSCCSAVPPPLSQKSPPSHNISVYGEASELYRQIKSASESGNSDKIEALFAKPREDSECADDDQSENYMIFTDVYSFV